MSRRNDLSTSCRNGMWLNETGDLFHDASAPSARERIAEGAYILRAFARESAIAVLARIEHMTAFAPFRHLLTPGGFRMSVAMTNCGTLGWVSDRRGYRYQASDPLSGRPWPPMPEEFSALARRAAEAAGFADFEPDVCLINRYAPGSRLTLHQDKDEHDFSAPIVSVSLGLPAIFLFGGDARSDKTRRVPLNHGDVVVWGGPARLRHHGVLPVKGACHCLLGRQRINLTFRVAGSALPRSGSTQVRNATA